MLECSGDSQCQTVKHLEFERLRFVEKRITIDKKNIALKFDFTR